MTESGDEHKTEKLKKNGSVKKKKKVVDGPPPKASDVPGSKKIRVFKNGDLHHHGVKFVVNTRTTSNIQALLDAINQRIELPYGAKKLYSISGKTMKFIDDLENGGDYIAASNVFVPLKYGQEEPGVIRWETPGSSFKATPTHSASTITRSRSTEPMKKDKARTSINETYFIPDEKKKSIRAKSQAPKHLAAPLNETTKSDSDIPVAKKKKNRKEKSTSKPPPVTNGAAHESPKKVVKKEPMMEKKVEKKEEKHEKLNGAVEVEKKKILKKKRLVSAPRNGTRSGTRNGKHVEVKERRESEVCGEKLAGEINASMNRNFQHSESSDAHDDDESDRDSDRSYNQSGNIDYENIEKTQTRNIRSNNNTADTSSSSSSSDSSSSSSDHSRKSHLKHHHHHQHDKHGDHHHSDHQEHHHEHSKEHHHAKDHHHEHQEKNHHQHYKHIHNHHHHHHKRSSSSSSGGSIKSHMSIMTRGLPTAHSKRGSYTIERKKTPNGTVHVIHHHSSRHGSPDASRPATRRDEKKKERNESVEAEEKESDA
ncbi:hypothetical protein PFISCL1PPCAC_29226, partial [Pristionchus fissidentatus]